MCTDGRPARSARRSSTTPFTSSTASSHSSSASRCVVRISSSGLKRYSRGASVEPEELRTTFTWFFQRSGMSFLCVLAGTRLLAVVSSARTFKVFVGKPSCLNSSSQSVANSCRAFATTCR